MSYCLILPFRYECMKANFMVPFWLHYVFIMFTVIISLRVKHNLMAVKYMPIYGVSPDRTLSEYPTGVIDSILLFAAIYRILPLKTNLSISTRHFCNDCKNSFPINQPKRKIRAFLCPSVSFSLTSYQLTIEYKKPAQPTFLFIM